VSHMMAYFIAGIAALLTLKYKEVFSSDQLALLMRPIDSPAVAWGPALQLINGLFLSLVLYPFRSLLLAPRHGWWKIILLMTGLTVFNPQAPAPGNFEGLVYTRLPWQIHIVSLPELLVYAALFATFLYFWSLKPKKYFNVIAAISVGLILLMSTAGYLQSIGVLK